MRSNPVQRPRTQAPDARAARLRALSGALLLATLIIVLNGCGGGGSAAAAPTAQAPGNPGQTADLATAQKAYDGAPRVPAGFYDDPRPPGISGTVATVHLKASDLPGAIAGAPAFELCHDDLAQATTWSEGLATFMGSYADLVELSGNARYWELTRVPRADVTARLRHRVFKCSYLDRSSLAPQSDTGPAGVVNLRPLDSAAVQQLSEYLWQFTLFNNADHVVLDSAAAAAAAGTLAHAITMARLARAGAAGACDRIDLLRWTHRVDTASGALTRTLELTRSFGARRNNGVVELCAG